MKFVNPMPMVRDAQVKGYAVPAFNTNGASYDIARAALEAAQETALHSSRDRVFWLFRAIWVPALGNIKSLKSPRSCSLRAISRPCSCEPSH